MIRVLIADDHPVVRAGLHQILSLYPDLAVAGEADDGAQVLQWAAAEKLDVLLLDISLPDINGIDLIEEIRLVSPVLRILILSVHDEGPIAEKALRAGANGYLTKDSDPEMLVAAIRRIAGGGNFIDPLLVEKIIFGASLRNAPELERKLSHRENQVFEMLVSGKNLSEIGTALSISAKTAATHKYRIMQKFEVRNDAELFRYAARNNLFK